MSNNATRWVKGTFARNGAYGMGKATKARTARAAKRRAANREARWIAADNA